MINKLSEQNLDELFELDNAIFNLDPYSKEQIRDELTQTNRIYLGYYKNNKLVAFVGVSVTIDFCDIIKIGVLSEYRKLGIAKELVTELIKILTSLGVKKILLEVREKNVGAILFYKKMGFNEIATRKNYYVGDNAKILALEI